TVVPCPYQELLFGFEMTEGNATNIVDVPVAINLGRVGIVRNVLVLEFDAVDLQAVQIPGVDIRAQVGRLPTKITCSIKGERRSKGTIYRAAGPSPWRQGA